MAARIVFSGVPGVFQEEQKALFGQMHLAIMQITPNAVG